MIVTDSARCVLKALSRLLDVLGEWTKVSS